MAGYNTTGDLIGDVLKGAIAGAFGVWAMDRVTSYLWEHEDADALRQERQARPDGLDPAHVIANRAAESLGKELTPKQPHPAGVAVHFGLGVLPGALYGALRHRVDGVDAAGGMLYGLGMFLVEDETVNPLLGTSGLPQEYPWQAHVRGLVGHLVLGAATEAALDVLDRIT